MSLLEELESRGVTAEDLEKAASVRLFEKAAAAEGVDLDSLDVDQVEELYAVFTSNQSDTDTTKEASTMNEEIVDLFEKTAAAEGIDLDEMEDGELAELYNHYVENVLPLQVEEYEKEAQAHEIDEAQEKLAEAEILGRHMARAYMDELDKEAAVADAPGKYMAMKALKAQGMSAAEAKAHIDAMAGPKTPSRKKQVKAAKTRLKRRKKFPGGKQAPGRKKGGPLSKLVKAEGPQPTKAQKAKRSQEIAGFRRVMEARDDAKKYLRGKASAVGKRRTQLGRILGGTTRASARRRGNIAAGTALAVPTLAGAAYGLSRSKEASADDYDLLVDTFEDLLLEKMANYDDYDYDEDDSIEDMALEEALENLYDAGFDLDEIE